jgi:hypothetical protein
VSHLLGWSNQTMDLRALASSRVIEKVCTGNDAVGFCEWRCEGEMTLKGVFPVHAVFEPDGAGLAGGTGRGWS